MKWSGETKYRNPAGGDSLRTCNTKKRVSLYIIISSIQTV